MSNSIPSSPAVGRPVRNTSVGSVPSPQLMRSLRSTSSGGTSTGTGTSPGMLQQSGSFRQSSQPLPSARRTTSAPTNMVKSMTIEEMRQLHHKALSDADAKRTELRLVLASRYRELVGSSEEVLRMRERSEELHQLIHALPNLVDKLVKSKRLSMLEEKKDGLEPKDIDAQLRMQLFNLPQVIHRALDHKDVHKAATTLIQLFGVIASYTDEFPLANFMGKSTETLNIEIQPSTKAHLKMTFLQIQTIPERTINISKRILFQPSSSPRLSASAIATLDLLQGRKSGDSAVPLLDTYFDSKATLLQSLLEQLAGNNPSLDSANTQQQSVQTDNAETILSQIVAILQNDIILHPNEIFVRRTFSGSEQIAPSLPIFESDLVKTKVSHFLAAHLPLIRSKVKSILATIAGTTASALGQIRQSLYDKTDGALAKLDTRWRDAVSVVVDVKIVLSEAGSLDEDRKFSLWSALFSNTFSNLVHSLLTTSFLSVHTTVVATLRTSLANAPSYVVMLPHEAYKNTLKIASDLDAALLKVSADAHELLVHAEERVESERRLRQSLYVQTCEIMGRLVCELRRMLLHKTGDDATKEFLVGRLCHLLKFRLTALDTLFNPDNSPAAMGGGGMITLLELKSAFELADDNDDGLITFEEAMEAVDSAFSGTQFHGAEMIRETLLLNTGKGDDTSEQIEGLPRNVTMYELALLTARGLRHDSSGANSALGTIRRSLDDIIDFCFTEWSSTALYTASETFKDGLTNFLGTAAVSTELEWQRLYAARGTSAKFPDFTEYMDRDAPLPDTIAPSSHGVSPYVIGYLLAVSSVLTRSTCPADSFLPNAGSEESAGPNLTRTIRASLLKHSVRILMTTMVDEVNSAMLPQQSRNSEDEKEPSLEDGCASALLQLKVDMSFVEHVFFEKDIDGFDMKSFDEKELADINKSKKELLRTMKSIEQLIMSTWAGSKTSWTSEQQKAAMEAFELFVSSLLGGIDSDSPAVELDESMSHSGAETVLPTPLPSSRRFGLLPIQADRSLAELQRRKYGKDKGADEGQESSAGVIGSGLGFFSSMLRKT